MLKSGLKRLNKHLWDPESVTTIFQDLFTKLVEQKHKNYSHLVILTNIVILAFPTKIPWISWSCCGFWSNLSGLDQNQLVPNPSPNHGWKWTEPNENRTKMARNWFKYANSDQHEMISHVTTMTPRHKNLVIHSFSVVFPRITCLTNLNPAEQMQHSPPILTPDPWVRRKLWSRSCKSCFQQYSFY